MSFDDLPDNWPELPLTDQRLLADVLDLVVSEQSRRDGALYVLLCDEQARLVQPIAIDLLEAPTDLAGREELMASVVSLSGGALFANVVSVVLLVIETVSFRRR